MRTPSTSRRDFLKTSAIATAAAVPYFAWTKEAYPNYAKNDRIPIGVIGCGSMGRGDAGRALVHGGEIVAVCDVDSTHTQRANKQLSEGKAAVYANYRDLLARDDVDVVIVGTPDHWHTRPLIDAVKAGAIAVLYDAADEYSLQRIPLLRKQVETHWIGVEQLDRANGHIVSRFFGDPGQAMTIIGVTGTDDNGGCLSR